MDRYGLQSMAFLIFLSVSVFYVLNSMNQGDGGGGPLVAVDSTASSSSSVVHSSSSSSSSGSSSSLDVPASSGIERLQLATVSSGEQIRRRLLQSSDQGYIGYGALSGDNVPCPPQSGRSYYTPNCQSASGPVNPYTRGCSTITRCARG